jgi:hypothetical protein
MSDVVILKGGPMDGWIVAPDAPALRPDWAETWPQPAPRGLLARLFHVNRRRWPWARPGRYVVLGNMATWAEG